MSAFGKDLIRAASVRAWSAEISPCRPTVSRRDLPPLPDGMYLAPSHQLTNSRGIRRVELEERVLVGLGGCGGRI